MILSDKVKSFFDSFESELDVKVYVIDKTEYFSLVYRDQPIENSLRTIKLNLGESMVNFLYDASFNVITSFLTENSEPIMKSIKEAPEKDASWRPWYNYADEICQNKNIHPYYLLLLKEIVNLYKFVEREKKTDTLRDDHFKTIGYSFVSTHNKITSLLGLFEQKKDMYKVVQSALDTGILDVHSSLIMRTETMSKNSETSKIPVKFLSVVSAQMPVDFWYYLTPKYLETNLWYKRCENCKRYFVTTQQSNARFCEHILVGSDKSCRQLMPKINLKLKAQENPADWLFNRAYKTMYSRVSSGNISKAAYKEWSKEARAKRNECTKGLMTPEEYSTWLCDSGLFIDYFKD